jgi:hypothetical protein
VASPLSPGSKPPKLLDRVRQAIRFKHYSPRTEQVYVDWIERFIRFHGIRHPKDMGADEVRSLAIRSVGQLIALVSLRIVLFQN